jgi:putative hemolysin
LKRKLLLVSLIASVSLIGCKALPTQPIANMANPAATNCVEQGGHFFTKKNKDGSQVGFCRFKDGSQCDAWAFKRGSCTAGADAPIVYGTK